MGFMQDLYDKSMRKASSFGKLAGAVGILALGAGMSGCASAYDGNPESTQPPVEQVEEGAYDNTYNGVTEETQNEVLETVQKLEAEGTYKVQRGGIDNREDIPVLKEGDEPGEMELHNVYGDDERVISFRGGVSEGQAENTKNLDWHCSMGGFTEEDGETYFLSAEHCTGPEQVRYRGRILRQVGREFSYSPEELDQELDVEYVDGDKDKDIAIFSADHAELPDDAEFEDKLYTKFANPDKIDRGDVTIHAGFPFDVEKNLTDGQITAERHPNFEDFYITDMPISPGDSGSPVYVLKDGEPLMMSVVNWYRKDSQNINGIARLDGILDLLRDNGVEFEETADHETLNVVEIEGE